MPGRPLRGRRWTGGPPPVIAALWVTGLSACAPVVLERVSLPTLELRSPPPPPQEPAPLAKPESAPRLAMEQDRLLAPTIPLPRGALSDEHGALLDLVARFLDAHPEITRLEIQGHMPRSKRPRKSKVLSQRGADLVRRELIERGVEPSRLVARGYGEDRPIADSVTPEGRAKNQRVELRVLAKRRRGR